MERNHVEQHKWRGGVSSLGLSYQGTIRPYIASYHTSRPSCKFSGGFSKGAKLRPLSQIWNESTKLFAFFASFQVIESENAEFAFIHDSSEIRYEVTKNCNLTEVGEVFAEQPYAIAVQQGSHLQEEISRKFVFYIWTLKGVIVSFISILCRILDLQKDRYFEMLASKYWNQTQKAQCLNSDDNEGITLESLGELIYWSPTIINFKIENFWFILDNNTRDWIKCLNQNFQVEYLSLPSSDSPWRWSP